MFSALKKLVTNEQGDSRPSVPTGMQTMGQSLQRKFAKGVQYNMKVIIKGDRNTGKSTLFHRLQGEKFREEYLPTAEIHVASIHWNYKATDDVVKVEVWDVVDKGKPRKRERNTLKIDNKEDTAEDKDDDPCLDATFLDVYKGTNGVVMMLDITKQWTWKYVQIELPKVPHHIPVLVMANFRDMGEHRAVYTEEVEYFIQELDRPPGSAYVKMAESSMRNGFGLKYLHSFFNIPFLQLQRETLLQQLQRNQLETDATLEELDMRRESEDQDYDMYLSSLSKKHKEKSKEPSASLNVPNGQAQQRSSDTSSNPSSASATPARVSPAHTPSQLTPSSTPPIKHKQPQQQQQQPQHQLPHAPPPRSAAAPVTQTEEPAKDQSLSQRFSKWFTPGESKIKQGTKEEDEKQAVIEAPAEILHSRQPPGKINDVDDFIPDEGLDRGFFDETDSTAEAAPKKTSIFSFGRKAKPKPKPAPPPVVTPVAQAPEESDSDDGDNPMVAGFQEELDSEDEVQGGASVQSPVFEPEDEPESPQTPTPTNFSGFPSRKNWKNYDSSDDDDDIGRPTVAVDEDVDSDDANAFHITNSVSLPKDAHTLGNFVNDSRSKTESGDGSGGAADSVVRPSTLRTDLTADSSEKKEIKSRTVNRIPEDSNEENEAQPEDSHSRTSSQSTEQEVTSPTTLGLTLQLEDLNFLESVTSKPAKQKVTRKTSRASDEFDMLVTIAQDEDISESETNTSTSTSSSAKKKKHRTKDKEKDEDKSHKKHKHKKHRDKDREERHSKKESSHHDGEEKKKKKKSSSKKRTSEDAKETKGETAPSKTGIDEDQDALEAFLEGF